MFLNIIFVITLYPLLFVFYALQKGSLHKAPGLYFGLHPPKEEALREVFVQQAQTEEARYQRRIKRNMLLCAPLPLVAFFTPYISVQLTIWLIWLLVVMLLMVLPFGQASRALRAWKVQQGAQPGDGQRYIELAGEVRRVKALPFALLSLASLAIGVVFTLRHWQPQGRAACLLVDNFALITPLFWLLAWWMDRQKTAVISRDSAANLGYTRAQKTCWRDFWLACAVGNTLLVLVSALAFGRGGVLRAGQVILLSTVYLLLTLGLLVWVARRLHRVKLAYADAAPPPQQLDDDEHWLWGMFYYNKSDSHFMVDKRIGIGTTVNIAHPAGKAFTIFGCLCLLAIPVMCIWLLRLDFTPIRLTVGDGDLVAYQLSEDYRIPTEQIEDLALVEELPELSKTVGTGMDTLCKGLFYAAQVGECQVFLNPQNGLFLRFEADGTLYYMSAATDAETQALYTQLQQLTA